MADDSSTTTKSLFFWAVLIVTGLAVYYFAQAMQG
jgi:hypothetical protein